VDLLQGLFGRWLPEGRRARGRLAMAVGRGAIVAAAVVTFGLSCSQIADPTGGSVAIFAQYGVYALVTASFVPLAAGMFLPSASRQAVSLAVVAALGAYTLAALTRFSPMHNNPAFLATCGILAGWGTFAAKHALERLLADRGQPGLAHTHRNG